MGKPRPSASLTWAAQPSPDWKDTFTNKVNYKHADCDGDSLILYKDTLAITTNYSKTHLKTFIQNQGSATDPHLSLILSKDTAMAADIIKADLILGNSTIPANLYGLAFTVTYPAGFIDTVLADFGNSWLSTDKLSLSKTANPGQLDMAIVRTNQAGTSGYGILATLYFKLSKTFPVNYTMLNIGLAENTQINAKGKFMPVYLQSDSILVKQTYTGVDNKIQDNISLFPNPANQEFIIRFENSKMRTITLLDMTGKEIQAFQNLDKETVSVSTSALAAGVYLLTITTENSISRQKIIIQH